MFEFFLSCFSLLLISGLARCRRRCGSSELQTKSPASVWRDQGGRTLGWWRAVSCLDRKAICFFGSFPEDGREVIYRPLCGHRSLPGRLAAFGLHSENDYRLLDSVKRSLSVSQAALERTAKITAGGSSACSFCAFGIGITSQKHQVAADTKLMFSITPLFLI